MTLTFLPLSRYANRILVLAAFFLAVAMPPAGAQEDAAAAVVEMTGDLRFQPEVVEIAVGETVQWTNTSGMQHTVTADPSLVQDPSQVSVPEGAEFFSSELVNPGDTFSYTFTVPGQYNYVCVPHQGAGMRGTVVVAETGDGGGEPGQGLEDPIPEPIPTSEVRIELQPVLEGLVAPNWGTVAPGQPNRLFVVDQTGLIYSLDLTTGQSSVFADLSARLVELGASGPGSFDERGLLGLAFHPDYQSNGLLYTYSSEPATGEADFSTLPPDVEPNHQSVVIAWQVSNPTDPASTPDPASARELLRINQPQFNHNAGALVFDPDGFLLIALGDGGNADDQGPGHVEGGNAQNLGNPLGAILRIDPQGSDAANGQYGIPTTNPFFGQADVVQEIYAYGFRNPFRISIDPQENQLWVADVGQNDIEEVNIVVPGGNYGWNLMEGTFFFEPGTEDEDGFVTDSVPDVDTSELMAPVAQYDHDEGIAIVGGFVYRGSGVPELAGRYIFGDYGIEEQGGRIFMLDESGGIQELTPGPDAQSPFTARVLGFGLDANGEVYVLANTTGTPSGDTGVVLRLVPAESAGQTQATAP